MAKAILLGFFILLGSRVSSSFRVVVSGNSTAGQNGPACLNGSEPCETLAYAMQNMQNNTTVVIDTPSLLHTDNNITISDMENITIISSSTIASTIDCAGVGSFTFVKVRNLVLSGLTFSNCSSAHASASYSTDGMHIDYLVGVYMHRCNNVIMHSVSVVNSPGVGAVMLNVTGRVQISDSKFNSNGYLVNSSTDRSMISPGGGGLKVELPLCEPGIPTVECVANGSDAHPFPSYTDVSYTIENCDFADNVAEFPNLEDYALLDFPNASHHNAIGRGGGLSFYIRGKSTNIEISVSHSRFRNNMALYGAGLFVELHHEPSNVTVTLSHSEIVNNSLPYNSQTNYGPGGGGFRFNQAYELTSPMLTGNTLTIEHSSIENNTAYFGAGLSLILASQSNIERPFSIVNSTFRYNTARVGAAIDLNPRFGRLLTEIYVSNILVEYNSLHYAGSQIAFIHGEGIVYVVGVTMILEGNNSFSNNNGSAITVLGGSVLFYPNVQSCFINNHSFRGAGMSLLGRATMHLYPGSYLLFENNTVATSGGAIFHTRLGNRALLDSFQCPIVRGFPTMDWSETSVKFVNNVARGERGHAIYLYSVYPCVEYRLTTLNDTFRWEGFQYTCTIMECNNSAAVISGDGSIVDPSSSALTAFPGERALLPLEFYDDFRQHADVVLSGVVRTDDSVYPVNFINSHRVRVTGEPTKGDSVDLVIHSLGDVILGITLQLEISICPPGWRLQLDDSTQSESAICVCESSLPGLVCNAFNFSSTLSPKTWVGFGSGDQTKVGNCPATFCSSIPIVLNGSKHFNASTLDEVVCGPQNRTGVLCGKCKPGLGISFLPSRFYQCVECDDGVANAVAFFLWVLLEFVPLNLLLVVFVIFKINLLTGWNGLLYTFILYFQVVTVTPVFQRDGEPVFYGQSNWFTIILSINKFFSNLWNLRFFSFLAPAKYSCMHPDMTVQQALTFIFFLVTLWPILVASLLVCSHHLYVSNKCCMPVNNCLRKLGRKLSRCRPNMPYTSNSSYIGSFCSFFVLAYTRVITLCFELLSVQDVLKGEHASSLSSAKVFKLNGTVEWFGSDHWPYAVPVTLSTLLVVIVPTLLLLSYPLFPKIVNKLKIDRRQPFQWIDQTLSSNPYFLFILNNFQGCFKDSARCFAAFYLVYRLLFIFVWSILSYPLAVALAQLFLSVLFIVFHSLFQPFTSNRVNQINTMVFGNLIIVIILNIIFITAGGPNMPAEDGPSLELAARLFTILFLFFPHIVVFVYFSLQCYVGLRACWSQKRITTIEDDSSSEDACSLHTSSELSVSHDQKTVWGPECDLLQRDSTIQRVKAQPWAGKQEDNRNPSSNVDSPKLDGNSRSSENSFHHAEVSELNIAYHQGHGQSPIEMTSSAHFRSSASSDYVLWNDQSDPTTLLL